MAVTTGKPGVCQLPLLNHDFVQALIAAGILADGIGYRKVTITCEPKPSIVTIEVELEADQRLLNLVPELAPEGS